MNLLFQRLHIIILLQQLWPATDTRNHDRGKHSHAKEPNSKWKCKVLGKQAEHKVLVTWASGMPLIIGRRSRLEIGKLALAVPILCRDCSDVRVHTAARQRLLP